VTTSHSEAATSTRQGCASRKSVDIYCFWNSGIYMVYLNPRLSGRPHWRTNTARRGQIGRKPTFSKTGGRCRTNARACRRFRKTWEIGRFGGGTGLGGCFKHCFWCIFAAIRHQKIKQIKTKGTRLLVALLLPLLSFPAFAQLSNKGLSPLRRASKGRRKRREFNPRS